MLFLSKFSTLRTLTLSTQSRRLSSNLSEFIKFYSTIQNFTFTKEIEKYLQKNVVFSVGHDKKFRPILYLYPSKVKENELELFRQSFSFYCLLVVNFLMRDYHIENWVIIIDLEKKGFLNFPFKAIQATINVTSLVFAGRMHKMFLVNPTFVFHGLWKLISKFQHPDVLAKIQLLKKNNFDQLLESISKNQLLEQYGGTLHYDDNVLPMRTTFVPNEQPLLTTSDIETHNFIEAQPVKVAKSEEFSAEGGNSQSGVQGLTTTLASDWDVV